MTLYAFDAAGRGLVATWSSGRGMAAEMVARLPDAVGEDQGLRLAGALTGLSRWSWRIYTHPASAAESVQLNTEGWRREQEREALAEVVPAVRRPNLPDENGLMLECYSPVEESAHQVGRVLHEVDDPRLLEVIVGEVETELAAVASAERGDLSGRARQAVDLSRVDASPVQVAAANALLRKNVLGSEALFAEVDPTAASVAAAHWLAAAAEVAGEVAGVVPSEVVVEGDDIEKLAVRTPTLVLDRLADGATPRAVVTGLIGEAMAAAEGTIPDVAALSARLARVDEDAEEDRARFGRPGEPTPAPRVCVLDPTRPARDLLEDLLDGLRGCWLVYLANVDTSDDEVDDDDEQDEDDGGIDEDELSEEFFEAVRAEAAANKARLL